MAICYKNYEKSWFFWYRSSLVPSGALIKFESNLFIVKKLKIKTFEFFSFIYALVCICLHKVDIICINPYLSVLLLIYTFLTKLWEFKKFWDLEYLYDF